MPRERMNLIIVEDEADFRSTCAKWFTRKGHRVEEAEDGQEGLLKCKQKLFDVAVVDMNMPGLSGMELLERLKAENLETEVIILTGQATVETAVAAMKLGASDYLTKPFPLAELEQRCLMAFRRGELEKENRQLKTVLQQTRSVPAILGDSPPVKELLKLIERVAPTDKSVLIEGESGTGKELVARAIHEQSPRAEKPLVVINCGALPEQLAESEFFGHHKGAFTGAINDKPGLFEVADGGTLFIDEIGELPLMLQPKLLRILEDGILRRIGGHQEREVDVRIIAATNRHLDEEVEAGHFREDLLYRINTLTLDVPPLRERGEDIKLLLRHFLGEGWTIEPDCLDLLMHYAWPGNIRQLEHVVERGKILADENTLTIDDLPHEIVSSRETATAQHRPGNHSLKLEDLEKAHVMEVLQQEKGNKSSAARKLGIHRRKLYRLIEKFEINLDE